MPVFERPHLRRATTLAKNIAVARFHGRPVRDATFQVLEEIRSCPAHMKVWQAAVDERGTMVVNQWVAKGVKDVLGARNTGTVTMVDNALCSSYEEFEA